MAPSTTPRFFYKFRACASETQRNYLAETIQANKLWFAARSALNDPHELKPRLTTVAPISVIRKYAKDMEQQYSRGRNISPAARIQIREQAIRQIQRSPDFLEPEMHRLLGEVGVLCLCESYKFANMWAHYADESRGLCLEFDANIGLFLHAQKVAYVSDYPIANRLVDTSEELLEKCMFTKHETWRQEHEWRVIARPHSERHSRNLAQDPETPDELREFFKHERGFGKYSFPSEALTGIIIGEKFEQHSWLASVLGRLDSAPTLYRAVTKVGSYDVQRINA